MTETAKLTEGETPAVIAWGEVLWDCLPQGMFLGGAPFNVVCHCNRLGLSAAIASAVGRDFPGRLIRRRAGENAVQTTFLHECSDFETGHVIASIDDKGNATYDIAHPVAWDHVPAGPELLQAAAGARALVFGSLAQRDPHNREALGRLLTASRRGSALRIFDVNLRPPFSSHEVVLDLAREADLIKLNGDELVSLTGHGHPTEAALPGLCRELAEETGAAFVCVTLGADGAAWWSRELFVQVPAPAVKVVDTVGAGDSFLAALIQQICREPLETEEQARAALARAAALGAFVASRAGPTPYYTCTSDGIIEE